MTIFSALGAILPAAFSFDLTSGEGIEASRSGRGENKTQEQPHEVCNVVYSWGLFRSGAILPAAFSFDLTSGEGIEASRSGRGENKTQEQPHEVCNVVYSWGLFRYTQ